MKKTFFSFAAVLLFVVVIQLKIQDAAQKWNLLSIPESLLALQEENVSDEEIRQYAVFWSELQCFPIPENRQMESPSVFFTDTWMQERNYGGNRKHEGCDLFGEKPISGYYPVISMTDGTVEKIGWLPLGGYRIGIRGNSGTYYYYAHLTSYGDSFQEGDLVRAGEILGFLGDTGYGEEGTSGQFPPHLHVGIYIRTKESEEYPVNPYWPLKYLEDKKKIYAY
ncbi:MAG: M23 family metallopeptidase [Lachnospiraceae bacterium]